MRWQGLFSSPVRDLVLRDGRPDAFLRFLGQALAEVGMSQEPVEEFLQRGFLRYPAGRRAVGEIVPQPLLGHGDLLGPQRPERLLTAVEAGIVCAVAMLVKRFDVPDFGPCSHTLVPRFWGRDRINRPYKSQTELFSSYISPSL